MTDELGDFGYKICGGRALDRHLIQLRRYGYVPGFTHVTTVGYSDGAWLSSMCALSGVAHSAVAWAGWSFARFDEWCDRLPRDAVRGMRLELYVSAGDTFYNGTSGWFPPPGKLGSMRKGVDQIAQFFELRRQPTRTVIIAGIPFEQTLFSDEARDNEIRLHVDMNTSHTHGWLRNATEVLQATARIHVMSDAFLNT